MSRNGGWLEMKSWYSIDILPLMNLTRFLNNEFQGQLMETHKLVLFALSHIIKLIHFWNLTTLRMLWTCRNPSLGLVTKARACKGVGQEGSPWVTSHALDNAKECEEMNPHTPKGVPTLGVGVPVDSRIFRRRLQGSKPMDWKVFYIIEKMLKLRCLKWARMTHLNT
jgi:hypothetical protein